MFPIIKLKIIIVRRIILAGLFLLTSCRHGYNPSWQEFILEQGNCPNLLKYTEDFQDVSWYKEEAVIKNNIVSDPNNNPTADLIDISKNSSESRIYQHIDSATEGLYAFSIFLKAMPGKHGQYAIGMQFKGGKSIWNKEIVAINDSSWTRATVKLRTHGAGKLTVYPAYSLIKGATLNEVYAWGAQLELLNNESKEPSVYCGKNIILGTLKIKKQFIDNYN